MKFTHPITHTDFILQPSGYYNLETNRYVNHLTDEHYTITNLNVVGMRSTVEKFISLNKSQLLINKVEPTIYHPLSNPFWIYTYGLSKHKSLSVGSVNYTNTLPSFSLKYLDLSGTVTKVIDGDTFELLTFIRWEQLDKEYKPSLLSRLLRFPKGLYIKVAVRVFGIDAKEKNTQEGKIALDVMSSWTGKKVWCQGVDQDKYGRYLALVYLKKPTNNLNEDYKHLWATYLYEKYPKGVCPYLGGKKST